MVAVFQFLYVHAGDVKGVVADNLGGGKLVNLVKQLPVRIHLRHQKISGADVGGRHAVAPIGTHNPHEVIIFRLVQSLGAGNRSWSHHPDHLTLHQTFSQLRVLHLLRDGYLVALVDQLVQIGIHRMERDAAHGRPLRKAALLPRQRNLQFSGCRLGILKKHLIKIPQAVEQDTVGILLLGLHVVAHHGG